jgi:CBS domain containing-hemolysin-like protein
MDKIPTIGEKFTFKNLDIEIIDASETRVNEVKITVNEPIEEEE